MTKEAIINRIAEEAGRILGRDMGVIKTNHANGTEKYGITEMGRERPSVVPVVHVGQYMRGMDFADGGDGGDVGDVEIAGVARLVAKEYEDALKRPHLDWLHDGMTKDFILRNTFLFFLNADLNRELAAVAPHEDYLDLTMFYKCKVWSGEGEMAHVTLTNGLIEHFGISEEELKTAAWENTEKNGYNVVTMADMLASMLGQDPEPMDDPVPMYVCTNKDGAYGTGGLIQTGWLRELAEKYGTDIFILPSSVNELIAAPSFGQPPEEMRGIVGSVNDSDCVADDELLSYNTYVYSRETGEVRIA